MKRIRGSLFVIDQAVSSVITFVLIAGLSRSGGSTLVGSVAILQTIALAGLAAARAIGVDVWAASGSNIGSRRSALSSSMLVAILVLTANAIALIPIGGWDEPLTFYWVATPLIVLLDGVRILLLHANRTWISLTAQSTTLAALVFALATSGGSAEILATYLFGTLFAVTSGFIGLQLLPPLPSIGYALRNRGKSGPFLFEISLGSITQQFLFMLLAVLSTVETAGQIRIAQTLLGPMSVIHSGLAPQLLRRLGAMGGNSRRSIARIGRNFGFSLAAYSLVGASIVSLCLPVEISGFSLLELLTGHRDLGIPPILAVCGAALACGAVVLGTGTSARVLGATQNLNRWRLLLVLPQVGIVAVASLAGNPLLAACGLAMSAAGAALMSALIVAKYVGKRGRRAKSD